MASEAQRIMNVSLTKIVSSRSRRGGVSLHRNLLVASVLFKARDVYAAEMAGLVVIRNGCVYDRATVDDLVEDVKAETQDLSNENPIPDDDTTVTTNNDNISSADENLICEEQIMDTINAVVVCPPVSDSTQEQSLTSDLGSGDKSPEIESDCELESCKENIEPANSNQITTDAVVKIAKRKRSRKLTPSKQCLKRKYTEVEQAVLSITENEEGVSKMSRVENVNNCGEKTESNCSELSSTSSPELTSSSDRVCVHREENEVTSDMSQDYKSCMDISEDAYSSTCDDSDDGGHQSAYDDEVSSYQSSFHSFGGDYCNSSSSTDAITFSLSHPMLVISV